MVFPNYPVFILLAPLAAGLIVGVLGRTIGPKVVRIGVAAEVIAFVLSLVLLYEVTTRGPQTIHLPPWSDGILQFGLYIDRLSAVMLVHIAAISILIHLFSIRYMQQERGYTRFHSLLAFTTFVLFGMVSSANLLMLFVFWQLLSWLLPLLSYNYSHPPTVRGAFRTFVMQRFGDVAFLAAVVLAYRLYGTLDFHQLFAPRRGASMTVSFALAGRGLGDARRHRRHFADLHRRHEQVGAVSLAHVAARFPLRADAGPCASARRDHQCRRLSLEPSGAALCAEPEPPCMSSSPSACSRRCWARP